MRQEKKTNVIAFPVAVETRDALNDQIHAALGIQLAVMGQGNLCSLDSSPICKLLDDHIAGLRGIAQRLEGGR